MPCGRFISPTDFLHQHPWCPKRCPASACAKREPPLCQFPVGTLHHCVECLACDFHVYPVSVTRFPSCPLQRRLAGPSQDNKNSSGMIIEYHWIISQNECPPSFHQMGRNLVSCKLQWFLVTSGVSSRLFFYVMAIGEADLVKTVFIIYYTILYSTLLYSTPPPPPPIYSTRNSCRRRRAPLQLVQCFSLRAQKSQRSAMPRPGAGKGQ